MKYSSLRRIRNTKANTRWTVGVWKKWREERNKLFSDTDEIIPEFSAMDATCMDYWLQRFIMEVRNQKGNEYTPKSLYFIVCCDICVTVKYLEWTFRTLMMIDLREHAECLTPKWKSPYLRESEQSRGRLTPYFPTTRQADPILPYQEDSLWKKGYTGEQFG